MILQIEGLYAMIPPDRKIRSGEFLMVTHVRAGNIGKDMLENVRNIFGGKMRHYSRLLNETVHEALVALLEEARASGYDGVYGVRISHPSVVEGGAEVVVCGNAFHDDHDDHDEERRAEPVRKGPVGIQDIGSSSQLKKWIRDDADEPAEPDIARFESQSSRLGVLMKLELFRDLPDEELMTLARQMTVRRLEAGRNVITQGEAGDSMHILLAGLMDVQLAQSPGESPLSVGELRPGEFFGEMSLFTGELRSATIMALTPSVTFEIAREDLARIYRRRPEVMAVVTAMIVQRLAINMLASHELRLDEIDAFRKTKGLEIEAKIEAFMVGGPTT